MEQSEYIGAANDLKDFAPNFEVNPVTQIVKDMSSIVNSFIGSSDSGSLRNGFKRDKISRSNTNTTFTSSESLSSLDDFKRDYSETDNLSIISDQSVKSSIGQKFKNIWCLFDTYISKPFRKFGVWGLYYNQQNYDKLLCSIHSITRIT